METTDLATIARQGCLLSSDVGCSSIAGYTIAACLVRRELNDLLMKKSSYGV